MPNLPTGASLSAASTALPKHALSLPPLGTGAGSKGNVERKLFTGPITGRPVACNIYFPPGYHDHPELRYPVVYRLHGRTDNPDTRGPLIIDDHERALRNGSTCPFIIVFPDGAHNALYADSKDGRKPVETQIVRELCPWVDANCRTIADPRARALIGWSMGGLGAMLYASKFPKLWAAAVSHDGGLRTWDDLPKAAPEVRSEIFGNDPEHFAQYSPFTFMRAHAERVRGRVALRLVASGLLEQNRNFRELLLREDIPHQYLELNCGHVEECVVAKEGENSWRFVYGAVKQAGLG